MRNIGDTLWRKPLRRINFTLEVLVTFFFGELLFIMLPLLVFIVMKIFIGSIDFKSLLYSQEFSFIVVVLNAVTLSDFIKFKVHVQKDYSFKLSVGSNGLILLLIASVLSLSFTTLIQGDTQSKYIDVVSRVNAILFIVGLTSSFMKNLLEKEIEYQERYKYQEDAIDLVSSKNVLFLVLYSSIKSSAKSLNQFIDCMQKYNSNKNLTDEKMEKKNIYDLSKLDELDFLLSANEKQIKLAKQLYDEINKSLRT